MSLIHASCKQTRSGLLPKEADGRVRFKASLVAQSSTESDNYVITYSEHQKSWFALTVSGSTLALTFALAR